MKFNNKAERDQSIIGLLMSYPGIKQKEISEALGIPSSTVSNVIAKFREETLNRHIAKTPKEEPVDLYKRMDDLDEYEEPEPPVYDDFDFDIPEEQNHGLEKNLNGFGGVQEKPVEVEKPRILPALPTSAALRPAPQPAPAPATEPVKIEAPKPHLNVAKLNVPTMAAKGYRKPDPVAPVVQEARQVVNTRTENKETSELLDRIAQLESMISRVLDVAVPSGPVVAPTPAKRVRACDSSENRRVLFISDMHAPYHHPDTIAFLQALNDKYCFDRVIHIGDELDYHAASFHSTEPEALGALDELTAGQKVLFELERLFPELDIIESNHGSMPYRKAAKGGLPGQAVSPARDIIFGFDDGNGGIYRPENVGDGWFWHKSLTINVPNQEKAIYIAHQISSNTGLALQKTHTNVVQGHYHSAGNIMYQATPTGTLFGMTLGCLIDDQAVSFAYAKLQPLRPIIGCGAIIEGVPVLFPMFRDKDNRWTGIVP